MWVLFCGVVVFFILTAVAKSGEKNAERRSKLPPIFKEESAPELELRDTDYWVHSKLDGWAYLDRSIHRNTAGNHIIMVLISCETRKVICLPPSQWRCSDYHLYRSAQASEMDGVSKYLQHVGSYRVASAAADEDQLKLSKDRYKASSLKEQERWAAKLKEKRQAKAKLDAAMIANAVASSYSRSSGTCPRCDGSGYLSVFSHVENGLCFLCRGSGRGT
ncbi:hypothetical protein EKG38_14020 [Shewanella canadensis]|uniref:Uncharacterized protein n=1 Tax=Shewanella canadensis TaxID=271096 RepID=A0A3S0ISD0_9GAMM|nr:hypothetical protein [Shewanella canadensis]RTR38616.1 hypothetical protein EKG38_14020 [Shewanella canadensis]